MDYANWYENISRPFRGPTAARALNVLDKGLVYLIAAGYITMLVYLAVTGDVRVWRAALVPAVTFAIVTIVRARLDAPRPYEAERIDPIIRKDTHGKSCPSRHVASAVIIACAITWINVPTGIAAFVACAIVAFTRVVGGVHYPRDVAFAIALAAACGLIGFLLIP